MHTAFINGIEIMRNASNDSISVHGVLCVRACVHEQVNERACKHAHLCIVYCLNYNIVKSTTMKMIEFY